MVPAEEAKMTFLSSAVIGRFPPPDAVAVAMAMGVSLLPNKTAVSEALLARLFLRLPSTRAAPRRHLYFGQSVALCGESQMPTDVANTAHSFLVADDHPMVRDALGTALSHSFP